MPESRTPFTAKGPGSSLPALVPPGLGMLDVSGVKPRAPARTGSSGL